MATSDYSWTKRNMDIFYNQTYSTEIPSLTAIVGRTFALGGFDILFTCTGCFGVLSNSFALVVILSSKSMRNNIANHFILNQVLIDLMACLLFAINIPTAPYDYPCFGTTGDLICKFWISLYFPNSLFMSSSLNLVIITIERYMEVIKPLSYKNIFSVLRIKVMMILTWAWGFVYFFIVSVLTTKPLSNGLCVRTTFFPSVGLKQFSVISYFVLIIVIPIAVMLFCYTRMALSLRSRVEPSTTLSAAEKRRAGKMAKIRINIFKTMVGVAICYFLTLIYYSVYVLFWLLGCPCASVTDVQYYISRAISYINLTVNPLIYTARYREFQLAAKKLLFRKKTGSLDETDTIGTQVDDN